MRLIDADELKNEIIHHLGIRSEENLLESERSIYNLIDKQPTVERPKKGKWITVHYLSYLRDFKRCTCCGYICQGWDGETGVAYDYCPDCGAEMENGNTNRKYVENPIITVLKERYKEDGEQE